MCSTGSTPTVATLSGMSTPTDAPYSSSGNSGGGGYNGGYGSGGGAGGGNSGASTPTVVSESECATPRAGDMGARTSDAVAAANSAAKSVWGVPRKWASVM